MNSLVRIALNTTPEQTERLRALQSAFSQVCNAIAPVVQQTRCWNRVALHHMVYKSLRDQFPALGSQMVCNAIYSVSRTSRLVFQNPDSPFNVTRLAGKELPRLRFGDNCPVYFDRHTLSVKAGRLSMFTLDGRMHFNLALTPIDEMKFHKFRLHEIVLSRCPDGPFDLAFSFTEVASADYADTPLPMLVLPTASTIFPQRKMNNRALATKATIPEYVMVEEAA